ncbi:MAG: ATP-dependent RecD-like DNA helicase [Verrucomicrobiota bacterium]
MEQSLSGVVERVTFHNEESGYCVLRVAVPKQRELVTVVGKTPDVHPGEELRAGGEWHDDPEYGRQFRAETIKLAQPDSEHGIERYLASDLIEGVGPVYAKKLVKKFGTKIFDIIDKSSKRLEEIEGIGSKRRMEIKASWEKQKSVREIMLYLHEHGISTARAVRIFKTYGEASVDKLKANPWQLARDVQGIGFKSADDIAANLGLEGDVPERVEAGLRHVLLSAGDQGHCGLPRGELLRLGAELLGVDEGKVENLLGQILLQGDLIEEEVGGHALVFPVHLLRAEEVIAGRIRDLVGRAPDYPSIDIPKAIDWCEQQFAIELAESQRAAIEMALQNRVLVITGGPGVGKTTILNSILRILRAKKVTPVLAAPTGRAAKRLSESTGLEAKTVHRLLEVEGGNNRFLRNEGNPLEGDLFVIDEASMMDVTLMQHFLRALPRDAHLLVVGDVDQLPSVGPGRVLSDFIESGVVPVARLTQIFRQAAESRIITAAHAINAGDLPDLEATVADGSDFFFIEREDPEDIPSTILKLVKTRVPERFGFDPVDDIQLLAPMNRGSLGVRQMNLALQESLNPPDPVKFEIDSLGVTFRVGDKVMQMRNNYDKEVFNGDFGRIREITTEPGRVHVHFDDGRDVEYEPGELDELSLAYAITIHKSQGSEFPAIVIPVATQQFVLLQRNLIYTGLTRGKKLVILVGQKKALQMAVRNNESTERYRGLLARLRKE